MPVPEFVKHIRDRIGNTLMMSCGAAGVVVNDQGEILLQRRSDNGTWGLPGGMIEPDEQPADAAIREIYEETGIKVELIRLSGVYSGPGYEVTYPNGNRSAIVSVVFLCRPIGGELRIDGDESLEVRYVAPDKLHELGMEQRHLERIEHALQGHEAAFFRR